MMEPIPGTGEKLSWTEGVALLALVGMLAYALFVWFTQPTLELTPPPTPPEHALKSMLIKGNDTYQLTTILNSETGGILLKKFPPQSQETARLVGATRLLLRTNTGASMYDMKRKAAIPVNLMESVILLTTNERGDIYYSTSIRNGGYQLSIRCRECNEAIEIPMFQSDQSYSSQNTLDENNLPLRRTILLSKYETTAVILDHVFSPRIALVNLMERKTKILAIPGLKDTTQIHFAPFFLDNRTLLFSVTDGTSWATYLYHVVEDRYEKFSDSFTDRAFFSMTGKLVLIQTYYNDKKMNVPFGSYALYARKRGTDRVTVDKLTGSGARAKNVRSMLFDNPEGKPLRFKKELTAQTFSRIENKGMRQGLLDLWQSYRYPKEMPKGSLLILRGSGKDDMKSIQSIAFQADPQVRRFEYVEGIKPLLNALEVPAALIAGYETRRLQAEAKGQSYTLVDMWWD